VKKTSPLIAATMALGLAGAAQAQSSLTLYGSVDQYFNHMSSSSGAGSTPCRTARTCAAAWACAGWKTWAAAWPPSSSSKWASATSGASADASRAFDRQSWAGMADSSLGEIRIGRQNTAIFYRGDYIDYTSRTLGSMVNNFGVPSRYDNDLAYISPRWAGLQLEGHFAQQQASASTGAGQHPIVQLAADYLNGPVRVGYAGLQAKAPQNAAINANVFYHNLYANYDYGKGKVYAVFVRSNNIASNANGNNAGQVLGNVGGAVSWSSTGVNRTFEVYQVSADYNVDAQWRVGALWGRISDKSGAGQNANGGSIGAYYALSKRTTLSALWETLRNDRNAGFRPSGSAGCRPTSPAPT
jgi:predicted porin